MVGRTATINNGTRVSRISVPTVFSVNRLRVVCLGFIHNLTLEKEGSPEIEAEPEKVPERKVGPEEPSPLETEKFLISLKVPPEIEPAEKTSFLEEEEVAEPPEILGKQLSGLEEQTLTSPFNKTAPEIKALEEPEEIVPAT